MTHFSEVYKVPTPLRARLLGRRLGHRGEGTCQPAALELTLVDIRCGDGRAEDGGAHTSHELGRPPPCVLARAGAKVSDRGRRWRKVEVNVRLVALGQQQEKGWAAVVRR